MDMDRSSRKNKSGNKKNRNQETIENQLQRQDEEVTAKLKKSLIITILKKLQNLQQFDVVRGTSGRPLVAQQGGRLDRKT